MVARQQLVVIGNGMVGLEFCVQACKRGLNISHQLTVFGEEPHVAYDRIRLTECMAERDPSELALKPRSWYADHGIDLRTACRVARIDRERRMLHCDDGSTQAYDTLVMATGSRAFVPPIAGADLPGVFTYRTIEDILAIKQACAAAKRAVIIGGGLLGLELAKAIQEDAVACTVVEHGPGVMIKQLNPIASNILQSQIEELGIAIRVEAETTAIVADGEDLRVEYEDGESDPCDLVVIAAGIRPRDELAREAELNCNPRGGIRVDHRLATSDPHIFGIGECVIHRDRVYGLAAPGYHMAEILAKRLNGAQQTVFTGFDLSTKLKLAGLDVWTIGDYQANGRTINRRVGREYRQLVVREGRLVGATVIGSWPELGLLQDAVARRIEVSESQLRRFQEQGQLFSRDPEQPSEWPEQAIVCTCMQVRQGVLVKACASGCATVEELSAATGAGTVCGSCKPLLGKLVGAEIPAEALISRGNTLLYRASLMAAVMILPFIIFDLPYDESVAHGSGIDVLWRDGFYKQVSGFTILGLSLLAVGLSLRKRVLRFGDYGWWRAVHALLGIAALAALMVHTGLRLGVNLNAALSISFLLVAFLGSISGGISALENRIGGSAIRSLRLWWTRAHIALVWLVLPLVLFHILSVYGY